MKSPDPAKTVETLRPMASSLAVHIRDHLHVHPHGDTNLAKQFYGVDNRPATAAWSGDRRITYRWPSGAEVILFNLGIIPPTPSDVEVTMEPEGQAKVVDALVRRTKNDSPVDLERTLKWIDVESEAQNSRDAGMQEVTAGLELGMRTLIGAEAGGEMWGGSLKAEQEFTMNLSAGYKQAWERATESSRGSEKTTESEWKFTILARHAAVFRSIVQETPMRETTLAKGELKFGIIVHAPGHWMFDWPNRRALLANLRGIPTPDKTGNPVMFQKEIYQAHPLQEAEKLAIFAPAYAEMEYSRVIQDSKQFDTDFTLEPIDPEATTD